ncbi:hypothetical protein [uncultured Bradyrhizobium sp.]|uniref:hypothetical protein n=1 Tax=uncultured Bradyrhizobium sp. TaxID=199684 RepID=UPI0035CC49AB
MDEALLCPSAQPQMPDAQILGVVSDSGNGPRVAYLNEPVAATPELLAQAAPAAPGEIFRLAARCETSKCTHFDGDRCQLATRIVAMLPHVAENLPPCIIRRACRWYHQEGRAACDRCPQVVTRNDDPDEHLKQVAGAPPPVAVHAT